MTTQSGVRAALVFLILAATNATSQIPTALVVDAPSCAGCTITARRIATIGTPQDSMSVGLFDPVAFSSSGILYIGSLQESRVYVYSQDGRFLRTIGRRGQGPGEFTFPRRMTVGAGDTLVIVDQFKRLNVFAPTGEVVRTGILALGVDQIELLADGRLLATADIANVVTPGPPIYLLSPRGEVIRRFGEQNVLVDPRTPGTPVRRLSLAGQGTVWSGYRSVVERWDTAGRAMLVFQRLSPLLPLDVTPAPFSNAAARGQTTRPAPPKPASKPESGLLGIRVDGANRVWLTMLTAATDWDSKPVMTGQETPYSETNRDQLLDTVVEVIDPESRRVLARTRLPFAAWKSPYPGIILDLRDTSDGPVLDVWRLDLQIPR